jgi:hypothetical protein
MRNSQRDRAGHRARLRGRRWLGQLAALYTKVNNLAPCWGRARELDGLPSLTTGRGRILEEASIALRYPTIPVSASGRFLCLAGSGCLADIASRGLRGLGTRRPRRQRAARLNAWRPLTQALNHMRPSAARECRKAHSGCVEVRPVRNAGPAAQRSRAPGETRGSDAGALCTASAIASASRKSFFCPFE